MSSQAKTVDKPRPLPPRPDSGGDSQPRVSSAASRQTNVRKRSEGAYESGYASRESASSVAESRDVDPHNAQDPENTPRVRSSIIVSLHVFNT